MGASNENLDSVPTPQGEMTLKVLADHRSVNSSGDVFAGWVAMHLDQAGEVSARKASNGARVVTVSIGSMSFLRPVQTGDLIGFFTRVTEIGKTSIKVVVEGWIENHHGWEKLTETTMVFVAIDRGGRTRRIRSL
ncbi:acyl-CoA thioesterase [Endozoicomonas sp. SESOKO1]|uniref:acyl-CoA thioesterase n=1 Tax=Endozoicomonas sp. SESOKO1 TaxID=2828742 RepID=UPI00214878F5|nr:hotdog domain-containing protein [Endozoicomonas sp. SESOKO1]